MTPLSEQRPTYLVFEIDGTFARVREEGTGLVLFTELYAPDPATKAVRQVQLGDRLVGEVRRRSLVSVAWLTAGAASAREVQAAQKLLDRLATWGIVEEDDAAGVAAQLRRAIPVAPGTLLARLVSAVAGLATLPSPDTPEAAALTKVLNAALVKAGAAVRWHADDEDDRRRLLAPPGYPGLGASCLSGSASARAKARRGAVDAAPRRGRCTATGAAPRGAGAGEVRAPLPWLDGSRVRHLRGAGRRSQPGGFCCSEHRAVRESKYSETKQIPSVHSNTCRTPGACGPPGQNERFLLL